MSKFSFGQQFIIFKKFPILFLLNEDKIAKKAEPFEFFKNLDRF